MVKKQSKQMLNKNEETVSEAKKSEEKIRQCPDCKSRDLERDGEEFYCKKCGLVIE